MDVVVSKLDITLLHSDNRTDIHLFWDGMGTYTKERFRYLIQTLWQYFLPLRTVQNLIFGLIGWKIPLQPGLNTAVIHSFSPAKAIKIRKLKVSSLCSTDKTNWQTLGAFKGPLAYRFWVFSANFFLLHPQCVFTGVSLHSRQLILHLLQSKGIFCWILLKSSEWIHLSIQTIRRKCSVDLGYYQVKKTSEYIDQTIFCTQTIRDYSSVLAYYWKLKTSELIDWTISFIYTI